MSRNPEKNAEVREIRKNQILDAALNVYIRFGYHGTDMDTVAAEAQLAKGLLYYYYKTKKELFTELYTQMFNKSYTLSDSLLKKSELLDPVAQLMNYTYGIFAANQKNVRLIQFNMRVPFDAYAVFGPDGFKEGAQKSNMHQNALAGIIKKGMEKGLIPQADPDSAANSFWSVFVANVFNFSKMMSGKQKKSEDTGKVFKDVVYFCFQGLGIDYNIWNNCLEKTVNENKERIANESI